MPMEAPCCENAMEQVSEKISNILKKYITALPLDKQKELIKGLVQISPKFIQLIDSL